MKVNGIPSNTRTSLHPPIACIYSSRMTTAVDAKREDEKKLPLLVERHGSALAQFDIVDGDRKVAELRESIQHNEKLPFKRSSWQKYRPVLDIVVTSGIDLSLVSIMSLLVI